MGQRIFDFTAIAGDGSEHDFSQYAGRPMLIVNTASKCGFTDQYGGLEELHQKYKSWGLVVIAFPCNQFAHQEPGSNREIAQFCQMNYGVTFPVMAKTFVNGRMTDPVFAWLKQQAKGGRFTSAIRWNFTKFLVSADGERVQRFSPKQKPQELESYIEKELEEVNLAEWHTFGRKS
ncbi:MAG: glutathione peroxidase [Spirochaetota bacterium]